MDLITTCTNLTLRYGNKLKPIQYMLRILRPYGARININYCVQEITTSSACRHQIAKPLFVKQSRIHLEHGIKKRSGEHVPKKERMREEKRRKKQTDNPRYNYPYCS